jgi:hypothetical protein
LCGAAEMPAFCQGDEVAQLLRTGEQGHGSG